MNDIKLLKKHLTKYKRKYNAELQANKSLIDANTTLVDKDRLLMFDNNILKEEIKRLNNIINELEKWLKDSNNNYIQYDCVCKFDYIAIDDLLDKLQELKESDKE